MYLSRRDDSDSCPTGVVNCMPAFAIIGQDPSQKENDAFGPSDYGRPGPHRFIGIGMVAGMIFLALILYLSFGKWPRKQWARCLRRPKAVEGGGDGEMMSRKEAVAVRLKVSTSSSSSEIKSHRDGTSPPTHPIPAELVSNSRKTRSSKHKSGAGVPPYMEDRMVQIKKDLDGERTGWEAELNRGVRYEVRAPKDDQTDERLRVHIQKPCLTYQP